MPSTCRRLPDFESPIAPRVAETRLALARPAHRLHLLLSASSSLSASWWRGWGEGASRHRADGADPRRAAWAGGGWGVGTTAMAEAGGMAAFR
jgi:hypothetical protein